jgi:hypothetical protein
MAHNCRKMYFLVKKRFRNNISIKNGVSAICLQKIMLRYCNPPPCPFLKNQQYRQPQGQDHLFRHGALRNNEVQMSLGSLYF